MLTPQTVTDVENIASEIISWEAKNKDKLLMTSFMGDVSVDLARKILQKHRILDFDYPRKGIVAFSRLIKQKKWAKLASEESVEIVRIDANVQAQLEGKLKTENKLCSLPIMAEIFKAFQVPFLEDKLATSKEDVERIWGEAKNKLVAKIASKDIAHKTDC